MMAKQESITKDESRTKDVQVVPAGDTTIAMAKTESDQLNLIFSLTPHKFIKQREGRGGKTFEYVETNYVIARLNAIFRCDWDLDVIEEKIYKEIGQIATKVRLTVRFIDGRTISKTAWGGSEIKTNRNNQIIDIADDLKSAESDALKKAASMLGICWDVYSGMTNGKNGGKAVEADAEIVEPDQEGDGEFDEDPREPGEEDEKEANERKALSSWIKLYLEKKTIDYKDFKIFLNETRWSPKRKFVGSQFGNLSLTEGKLEDLRYLKNNIDKCIDKYLAKRMKEE